jgi:single-strand DNA-binding protein
MHSVTLWGRLGRDVEIRRTGSGHDVANVRVGVDDFFKKDGRRQKKTLWFDVVAFDGLARVCADYLQEGSGVMVLGRLNFRDYTNRDGAKVKTFEVVADQITFTDRAPDRGDRDDRDDRDDYRD